MTELIVRMRSLGIVAQDKRGGTKSLVENIDLDLHRGEVIGLIGESGAGKTTIGLAALGYMRSGCAFSDGEVFYRDTDLLRLPRGLRRKIRGQHIAYVAQSAAASFNPAKSIMTQVCEMPVRYGLLDRAEAKRRAIALFKELDLPSPENFGNRYPHQVSGGQLQRAMVAMAMSCNPDVLVLDEPTTALDVTTQIEVIAAIKKLIREHHTAGLYISHDLAVVAQIADRVMVLRNGCAVEFGAIAEVLQHPHQDYTRRLLSVRAADAVARVVSERSGPPLLEIADLDVAYGARTAVRHVSLTVAAGETLAVVGESGSGKSTLARAISGLKEPKSGAIKFRGAPLAPSASARRRDDLRRIQLIYQMPDMALNPKQRISLILSRPLSFYHGWPRDKVAAQVKELLRLVELPAEIANRYPAELSGGQKQRVCIARALAAEPDLIICDEVTSALDALVAEEVLKLLDRLQRERGVAYIFITHDLGIVRRVADRVAVMLRGEIVASGPVAEVFSPPFHPYTETLLSSVPEMRVDWLDETLRRRHASSRDRRSAH